MNAPALKDSYPGDDYVRLVAQQSTRCFGLIFDHRDEICKDCPLAASCQARFYENLEKANGEVDHNEDATQAPEEAVTEPKTPSKQLQVRTVTAFAGSICIVCGGEIEADTQAQYLHREGFFHMECKEKLYQGVRHGKKS